MKKKPGVTARSRAQRARKDRAYAAKIRTIVVERDGYCRYGHDVPAETRSECFGPSEWAHIGDWKRFKTRGQSPQRRHCSEGSMMLCRAHHQAYDAGTLAIDYWPPNFCNDGVAYWENGTAKPTNPEWWL